MNQATFRPPHSQPLQTQYLTLYNLVSALLWLTILGRVVLLVPLVGFDGVYIAVGQFVRWTQTLAILEIGHSAFGLVRSPTLTTFMQVASRLVVVWLVTDLFPDVTTPSLFYSSMLLAWSTSEIIRYSYFVLNLGYSVPDFVTWLRYNAFFVLYPVGIGSETVMVWRAKGEAGRRGLDALRFAYWGQLLVWLAGTYVLFSHMMAQRRKHIRGKQPERRRNYSS